MKSPREMWHSSMRRIFTGARCARGGAPVCKATRSPFLLLAVIGLGCFVDPHRTDAEPQPQYGFEEGEPLQYRLDIAITNETAVETQFYDRSDKSRHDSQVNLRLDYQLMPISRKEDGLWKVRIVLDKLEEAVTRDGEVKRRTLDRDQLGISEIRHVNLSSPELRGEAAATNGLFATDRAALSPTSAAEDLFADPIVASIRSDGTIQKFEDRTELKQVIPGFDLKECLEIALPPLPAASLKEGTAWTREVPVDLPEPPLAGHQAGSMKQVLNYSVAGIDAHAGKRSVRIRVQGHAVFDGLSIPIRQEEIKYLIWTTRVSKIEDTLEGEYVYDLESKTISFANVCSTYRFSTVAARKEDKQRGKILSDNVVRTRIITRQTNRASIGAQLQPSRPFISGGGVQATTQSTKLSEVIE